MSKALRFYAFLLFVCAFSVTATVPGYSQDDMDMKSKMMDKGKEMMCPGPTSATSASALRKTLNLLLAEHVYLGAMATNAALNGNQKEFEAAAAALDLNSQALAAANGSVYGQAAADAFLPLWRKHIGFLVDYTQAVAAGDMAKKQKAMDDLNAYAADFAAFIHSASPSLPVDAVTALVQEHGKSFLLVIDDQAAGDDAKALIDTRMAAEHMQAIADAHAEAIVQQFPDKFQN